MPAFNTSETIAASIRSALAQTRDDFELLVVDDGSTDDTASRVRRFSGDSRVRLIEGAHQGPSGARNAAIAVARGRYVSFLDSDDLWMPRYLEVMGAILDAHPEAAVAYTDAWVLYDELKKIGRRSAMQLWLPSVIPQEPQAFLHALLRSNFVYSSATIRRSLLAEVGGLREALPAAVDYELWLRIAARGHRFVRSPGLLAVYRRRAGQITAERHHVLHVVLPEVFRVVAEEYDVPDETRRLAWSRKREQESLSMTTRSPGTRSVPVGFRRIYRIVWRLRHFYVRPPLEIRRAFPDLMTL